MSRFALALAAIVALVAVAYAARSADKITSLPGVVRACFTERCKIPVLSALNASDTTSHPRELIARVVPFHFGQPILRFLLCEQGTDQIFALLVRRGRQAV